MISDLIRNQSVSITSIKEILIFLMKMLRHVTEIIRNIVFVISEIYILVIVVQARLISSLNTKNMCSRRQLFNEVRR